jgi:surfactin synthase thioesterase subunit/phosphopantetheinyl transferase
VIICLPHAGGGASAFRELHQRFPPSAAVEPVHLPGRQGRIGEPPRLDVSEVATAIADRVRTPYALYGHSMGARLGFEVVRELRRRGALLPVTLFVGAAHAPHLHDPFARLAELGDEDFIEQLVARADAPTELRDDPDVRSLALPALRADFDWIQRYRFRSEPPLPVPIVALAAEDDRVLPPTAMLAWARHSTVGLTLHTLPGTHLFLQSEADRLARLLAAELASAVDGTAAGPLAGPAADEVHVWLARLDRLPGHCAAVDELSPRERERAAAVRHERDRRRVVGRSVALRRLLRRYGADLGAAEVPTRHGGPYVTTPEGLRVGVSHADDLVLVAVTRGGDVGVAVERARPAADLDAFCDGALGPEERAEVAAASEDVRLRLALEITTAKAAVRRATGDDPGPGRLGSWRVTHLPLDGAVGAVAVAADGCRLRYGTVTEAPG